MHGGSFKMSDKRQSGLCVRAGTHCSWIVRAVSIPAHNNGKK